MDPQLVMTLHRQTGLPVMDCKSALIEADGDIARAIEVLKREGLRRTYVDPALPPGFWERFAREPPQP